MEKVLRTPVWELCVHAASTSLEVTSSRHQQHFSIERDLATLEHRYIDK